MVRTAAAFACFTWMLVGGCLVGTATAQPAPPPPNPGIPLGPNMPAMNPPAGRPGNPGQMSQGSSTAGSSTAGASGVLRVMIPDSKSAPAAAATGTGLPAAPPAGSGRPDFRPPAGPQPPVGNGAAPNDPTVPNSEIRRILEGAGRDNAPPPAAPAIPLMRVRARVFVSGQPPVAVLEIGGRQLTVREGSEIHLMGGDSPAGMQLRVARMTTSEIRLEVVNKNQFITLD